MATPQWHTSYSNVTIGELLVSEPDWDYITSSFSTSPYADIDKLYTLYYTDDNYLWANNKTYQFITDVSFINYGGYHNTKSGSFSVTTNWMDTFIYADGATPSDVSSGYYIFYSSPPTSINNDKYLTYNANGYLNYTYSAGIYKLSFNEIDFKIQGFSYFRYSTTPSSNDSLGWSYDKLSNGYYWYDKIGTSSATPKNLYPVGGDNGSKTSDVGYRLNNYISKFIPYTYFNLSFSCSVVYGAYKPNNPLEIWLSPTLPTSAPSTTSDLISGIVENISNSQLIGTVSNTVDTSVSFYGLKGNQYIYFRGGFAGITSSIHNNHYSQVTLTNITIDGAYHPDNNDLISITYSNIQISPTGLTGSVYSAVVGHGNTLNESNTIVNNIFSKIGNGKFISGIWENGVWNSGWRDDEVKQEFYNVSQFVGYQKIKRWRVQLQGPTSSVYNLNIGDNVAIGNIIAIDINENRKLLKNYFTIVNKTTTTITVEFDNDFPLRRIEKDSNYHRIYVTKNIWLSGGFLNGYFSGVWNYGLFKGYPLITEMYDTHWIDGIFDGGHFNTSNYTIPDFIDTFWVSPGKVGLSFSATGSQHGLSVGDLIIISNDIVNPQYNTDTYITKVIDNYNVETDLNGGISGNIMESGSVSINLSTGLIQNTNFKSNNISTITSNISMDSYSVFIYNSWMDVNYYDTSATNIGKPQNLLNSISRKQYSENNLYGYPTNDVLSSDSSFRDSFSTTVRNYKLGTKYKIFSDFIGDSGTFENYFDTPLSFIDQGWTFSISQPLTLVIPFVGPIIFTSSLTFSRTLDTGIPNILGEELKIESTIFGGILEIGTHSSNNILNRNNEIIQKNRYTKIEFDIITFSNYDILLNAYNSDGNSGHAYIDYQLLNSPVINFTNLNYTKRGTTYVKSTYLPIYNNIEHIFTNKKSKVEYFYNKTNLSMWILGNIINATTDYTIDNLHFYEIDMIPFFQYFTDNNINKSIQIPYQGLSPFIDYSNANFRFIDNIAIGLDSIQTVSSNTVISGVGIGNTSVDNSAWVDTVGNSGLRSQ